MYFICHFVCSAWIAFFSFLSPWLLGDSETAWKDGNTSVTIVEWVIYLLGSSIRTLHLTFLFLYVRLFLLLLLCFFTTFFFFYSLPLFVFRILLFPLRLFNFIYILISYSVFVLIVFFCLLHLSFMPVSRILGSCLIRDGRCYVTAI